MSAPNQPLGGDTEAVKNKMAAIDAKTQSPSQRALRVLEVLRKNPSLTTWDVLCFCSEYLGMMVPAYPWLDTNARNTARIVYLAHYIHFGGPADEKSILEALL